MLNVECHILNTNCCMKDLETIEEMFAVATDQRNKGKFENAIEQFLKIIIKYHFPTRKKLSILVQIAIKSIWIKYKLEKV